MYHPTENIHNTLYRSTNKTTEK